jgi:hypothetical protein
MNADSMIDDHDRGLILLFNVILFVLGGQIAIEQDGRGCPKRLLKQLEGVNVRQTTDLASLFSISWIIALKGFRAFRHAWPIYAYGIARHFARYLTEELCQLTGAFTRILAAAHTPAPQTQE